MWRSDIEVVHPFFFLRKPFFLLDPNMPLPAFNNESFVAPALEKTCGIYKQSASSMARRLEQLKERREKNIAYHKEFGYLTIQKKGKICGTLGFTSGLADSGALENVGLQHEFLSGLPVYNSSSLKGVLRSAAMDCGVLSIPEMNYIFGRAEESKLVKNDSGEAGQGIFFDALPEKVPTLCLDIANVHQKIEYSERNPPADWNSPNPVKFLVLKNLSLCVDIMVRPPNEKKDFDWKPEELKKKLVALIKYAFEYKGFGAKTSSGYGFFEGEKP